VNVDLAPFAERIYARSEPSGNGCLVWTGARNKDGYGLISGANTRVVHRVTYEATNGPIPAGLQLDHLCRNPACVNPAHLEAVTPQENVRRSLPFRVAPTGPYPCGHERSDANSIREHRGTTTWGRCRICKQTKHNARRLAKRAAARQPRTHCKNGHPWTEANRYLRPDGKGSNCRVCMGEAARRYEVLRGTSDQ